MADKYLELRLTLDEVDAIFKKLFTGVPSAELISQITAQIEAQQENPHPDAVVMTKERFPDGF
jgi:uncharacterized short protein YbdD (DUF466 family)